MKAFFEYIPLVVFFAVYKFVGIYWATAALIGLSAAQIGYFIITKQEIPKRQWVFFALIAVFGSLTIFFQNDLFLKWKVTIINGIFAIALLVSHYLFNKNIIKEFLGEALVLPQTVWSKLNLAWAMFFILCALLNIFVAFSFDQETWVNFKVFGLTGLTFVFAIGSVLALHKHMPDDDGKQSPALKANSQPEE
jgi:intracellular septation protein